MENNYFDDWIKKELDDYQVPIQPNDWAMMEERLDQDFDDWVKEGIEEPIAPFGESDWASMEKQLDKEDRFQERYFIIKGLEVLILALVLLTISEYMPYSNTSYSPYPQQPEEATEFIEELPVQKTIPQNKELEQIPTEKYFNSPVEEEIQEKDSNIYAATKLKKGRHIENRYTSVGNEAPSNKENIAFNQQPSEKKQKGEEIYNETSSVTEVELIAAINNGNLKPEKALDKSASTDKPLVQENKPLLAVRSLGNLDIKPIGDLRELSIKNFKTKPRLRLGMYVSPDANLVFTPYSQKTQESYRATNIGFSGGFTVGFSKDRWETETGIGYALISYRPREVIEIKGSVEESFFRESLKDIEFNLVSIPLNFSYNFLYHKGWKFYAKTGATLNVVALSSFYQRQDIINSAFVPSGNPAPTPVQRPSPDRKGGLFVDNTFNDNYFVTANFGLGAERLLTNNFSVYLEPSFSHTIHGAKIGPNNDKINTVSLNMGAKITL